MIFKNHKPTLNFTNLKSGLREHVKTGSEHTASSTSYFAPTDWFFVIGLMIAVFLVYYPAWHGGFVWDDNFNVTKSNLRSWYGLFHIWFNPTATHQYYPLTHNLFWIQYWLWGEGTLGYHLVNIFLHSMAAVMVGLILRKLAIPGAFFAAAIFALHPVHVESVAWISELKNTLSTVLYLGSAMVYLRFDQQRKKSFYFLALALFVLAILSKTAIVTLPAALLVIFWWQRGSLLWKKDILPLLPFFICGISAGFFTIWVEKTIIGAAGPDFTIPFLERILIAGQAIWFYLSKLFWPADLIFIYPRWDTGHASLWQFLFPAAVIVLLATLWLLRRHGRGPLAGYLFFIGTSFPVLGFFNVLYFTYSFVADHFQYLASIGIIALFAAAVATFLKRLNLRYRQAGYFICLLLLLILASLTWRQCQMFTDMETLYRTTISKNPQCWMAHNNLGIFLSQNGRFDEAISHFQKALEIKPNDPEFLSNLGISLDERGRFDEAISLFQKALRIMPDNDRFHNNLGVALMRKGNLKEALSHYQKALYFNPDRAECHLNVGIILSRSGRTDEAIIHFQKALEIKPDFAEARQALQAIYDEKQKITIRQKDKKIDKLANP